MAKDFLTRHQITRRAIELAAKSTEELRPLADRKNADAIERKAARRVLALRDRKATREP